MYGIGLRVGHNISSCFFERWSMTGHHLIPVILPEKSQKVVLCCYIIAGWVGRVGMPSKSF